MTFISKLLYILGFCLLFASCSLLTAAGISSQGQPTKKVDGDLSTLNSNNSNTIDHSTWNRLLQAHVDNDGMVDYKSFKKDRKQLDDYLNKLAELEPTENWSVQELLAYYINLYNAATVELVVDNYPTSSIKDIKNAFTKSFIKIGNRELSLGGIENGVLRKMNEPRIHFAVNCASISCPKLLNEAFKASTIDEQLDKVTKEFINGNKNDISKENPKLSKIFDWYASDFTINGKKDVIGYVNQYSKRTIDSNASLHYKEYDWNLNEQE